MNFDSIRNLAFIVLFVIFFSSIITLFTSSVIEGLEMQEQSNPYENYKFVPVPPVNYIPATSDKPVKLLVNFISNLNNSLSKLRDGIRPLESSVSKVIVNVDKLTKINFVNVLPNDILKKLSDDEKQRIQVNVAAEIGDQSTKINKAFYEYLQGIGTTIENLNGNKLYNDFDKIKDLKLNCKCRGIF
jgi:hypothetical protein